jgi:NAD(P)-dependent dehydrogenase (short-subunit alcohol dehydrogenase family)
MTLSIDLSNRRVLVTGAGQGVGRGICHAVASAGGTAIVNDYVPERSHAVVAEIEAAGGRAEPAPFDVSDHAAVADAIDVAGRVDVLVNNAGNSGPEEFVMKPFVESDPSEWRRYLEVNLLGAMNCTHAALPGMIEREYGRVITIVSDAARWGEPTLAPYSAAKAGAAGLTRAVAREVGRYGITANNIALASVDPTGGRMDPAQLPKETGERFEKQLRSYIIRRFGRPDEVAALVTFLASDFGAWITGQTIPLNGGYTVNQ